VAVNRTCFDFAIIVTLLFTIILSMLSPALAYDDQQQAFTNQTTMTKTQINNNDNPANGNSNGTTTKAVILNFYDDEKDQFTNAKPILDKYG
jgi:hypothetical protein